ncbi:hypothetical protein MTR67_030857 [Solanum verrucosum]|uniref:Flavin-containing monooxygenase n=1 Tax=Solanum verrucosum TaxID=315347 RepID=A0AAF0ZE14_SOLVR|nr:hypothetical protein MTR67_030857 [Solanum verrucosum]
MEIGFDISNYESHTTIIVRSPVLPGILEIKEHTVVFDNEDEHQFDAIIFATGYKNNATKWLKIESGGTLSPFDYPQFAKDAFPQPL